MCLCIYMCVCTCIRLQVPEKTRDLLDPIRVEVLDTFPTQVQGSETGGSAGAESYVNTTLRVCFCMPVIKGGQKVFLAKSASCPLAYFSR